MPIIQCPECDAKLKGSTSTPRKVRCPKCSNIFQVGGEEEPPEIDDIEEEAPAKTPTRKARRRQDSDEEEERPRKARRRQDDEDDEADPLKSRRRKAEEEDDEDSDDDDEVPTRDRPATVQFALGVSSLGIAALVLLTVWVPAMSSIALPLAGVGVVLGLAGLIFAIMKGVGHGFPIAGCEISGIALVVSVLWIFVMPEVRRGMNEAGARADRTPHRQRQADFGEQGKEPLAKGGEPQEGLEKLTGTPTRASGTLTLKGGTVQMSGQLTDGDPMDRLLEAPCKVYFLNMTAGKTYQIDMRSSQVDSFLRLEDPEGRTNLAEDDDSGGDLHARIVFRCSQDGRYRIVATALDDEIGSFTLRVQEK